MASIFKPVNTGDALRPAYFSDVSNLTFSLSTSIGDIAIGSYLQDTASGFLPDGTPHGGDVWLGLGYVSPSPPGAYENYVLLHEIGHALGLEHGNVYPKFRDGDMQPPDGSASIPIYKYSFMYLEVKGTNDSLVLPHWIYRDEWAKKVMPGLSYASDSMVFEQTGTVWNMDKELEKNLKVTEVADETALWSGLEIYLIAQNNPLFIDP